MALEKLRVQETWHELHNSVAVSSNQILKPRAEPVSSLSTEVQAITLTENTNKPNLKCTQNTKKTTFSTFCMAALSRRCLRRRIMKRNYMAQLRMSQPNFIPSENSHNVIDKQLAPSIGTGGHAGTLLNTSLSWQN